MSTKEQRRAASDHKKRKVGNGDVAGDQKSNGAGSRTGAAAAAGGAGGESDDEDEEADSAVGSRKAGPSSIPRVAQLQAAHPLPIAPSSSASSSTGAMASLAGNDIDLHRCRFVDYVPGAITALALTPSTWDTARLFPSVGFGAARSEGEDTAREVLAVGRGNGDIEIWAWAGRQHWIQVRRLPGHQVGGATAAPKIEHLVFAHQTRLSADSRDLVEDEDEVAREEVKLRQTKPRLLGSTGGQEVVEWEWDGGEAGRIMRTLLLSASTTIWSMALSPGSSMLAVGCDDGIVRIVSLQDDSLELARTLDPCRTRLLSVAWGRPESHQPGSIAKGKAKTTENGEAGHGPEAAEATWVIVGCADSSLRKLDVRSGRALAKMTVDKMKGEQTLVWAVAVLADTIVSGDSLGNIKFFDPVRFTQLQSLRPHRADILVLCPSSDGSTIYSAGVDQRTRQLTRIGGGTTPAKWAITGTKRLHSHDVRALAVSPPFTYASSATVSQVPILISGGIDSSLVLCSAAAVPTSAPSTTMPSEGGAAKLTNPINGYGPAHFVGTMHRRIWHVPQRDGVVSVSPHDLGKARARGSAIMVLRKEAGLTLWKADRNASMAEELLPEIEEKADSQGWEKVLDMDLKCQTNLISSTISANGRWLAVSDLYEAKLFMLDPVALAPRRVKLFAPFQGVGASHMAFSPDSSRLVVASAFGGDVAVVSLPSGPKGECEVIKVFDHHRAPLNSFFRTLNGRQLAGQNEVNGNGALPKTPKTPNGVAALADADSSDEEETDHVERPHASPVTIARLAISSDGQWAASVDSARRLHVFNLDLLRHHCALPSPDLLPACLRFMPSSPSHLVVGLPDNSLHVFDVESRSLADWARHLSSHPPQVLKNFRDPMIGLAFDPALQARRPSASPRGSLYGGSAAGSPASWERSGEEGGPPGGAGTVAREDSVMMWAATWICRMSFTKPSPYPSTPVGAAGPNGAASTPSSKKRRRHQANPSTPPGSSPSPFRPPSFRVSHKYKPLLLLDFVGPSEMVVVERPYFNLVESLPPAWERSGQYGT